MRKTYESIDHYVEAESAYLPLKPEARNSSELIPEVPHPHRPVADIIDEIDPEVIVRNHRLDPGIFDSCYNGTVVHLRHGASVGRGETDVTLDYLSDVVDVALAPGKRWAQRYRDGFPNDVVVTTVGIPEADQLVGSEPPGRRRVLYAPTNHNYGSGSYLNSAEDIVETFENTDYELLFRPHPMDRIEEPGKSLTERCRERIEDIPNVTFDVNETPIESVLSTDVLISDYSGIITEWIHTDRPLIQLSDLVGDRDVPSIGTVTETIDIGLVDDLYENGPPSEIQEKKRQFRSDLGIPMDGQSGERVATQLQSCTE